ncbi:MAG: hypothetical protein WA728_14450 [Xanthobacteraceae bacterium]
MTHRINQITASAPISASVITPAMIFIACFELAGIVSPLASEVLWLKTYELPLKLCE